MLIESVSEVMLIFDDILKKGFEADIFINGFAEHLRNLLVCKDVQTLELLEVSETLKERYNQQAQLAPASFILTALNIANDCDVNYKMARNKRLHVEMALIKMAYINRAVKLANLPKATSDASAEQPITPHSEKKTPESNGTVISEPIKEKTEPPLSSEVKEEQPTFKAKETPKPEQPAVKPKLETASVSTNYDTPRLVDLSDLEEELEKENEEVSEEKSEISTERFKEVWDEYAENIKSPSVRTTISKAEFTLEDDMVKVTVGSTMAKEMVQQEIELIQFIRDQLNRPDLLMTIDVDPDKLPEEAKVKPKKLLSTKEKYDLMKNENPLIDEMRKRFDLKPDYD